VKHTATLLIDYPDQRGLIARVSTMLYAYGASIMHADQHRDHEAGLFFMRVEWGLVGFELATFREELSALALELRMNWRLEVSSSIPRVAIFVSQQLHCLIDLLYRQQSGELACEFVLIFSNHGGGSDLAAFYGVPFHQIPLTSDSKQAAETEQLRLLAEHQVDLIVLARYMQVLSPEFVARYPNRIINVHHSFLPAFVGARPYHRAFERGVKLIGATSHYVSEVLDDGPIIEQDVARVSHRDQLEDLIEKGRDLERVVLSRAVRWHLSHRILSYGNKTVVFD
jgi:formyltetrahydrofolate deformylase